MNPIKTLLGFPVQITNPQVGDLLFFNGQAWVNTSPLSQPTTYTCPTQVFNPDERSAALDGIPVRHAPSILNMRSSILGLQGDAVTVGNGITEVYPNLINVPYYPRLSHKPTASYATNDMTQQEVIICMKPQRTYTIV